MKTVILMWNPAISDFKIEDLNNYISGMNAPWWVERPDVSYGQWAVHDKSIKDGDRCFLMRVGDRHAGLVMSGWITSNPFYEDNWNGDGTKRPYVKFEPEVWLESSKAPHISLKTLEHLFPSFEWSGGHSGRVLSHKDAARLEKEWFEFLYKNRESFEKSKFFANNDYHLEINSILNEYLQNTLGTTCGVCGHNYRRLFGEACELTHDYYFLPPCQEALPKDDNVWKHVKCLCPSCLRAYEADEE